jgi:6-phosphogluconolactonase
VIAFYPDGELLAQAAASLFVSQFKERMASSFSVVLSGGSTPRRTYGDLAEKPFRDQIDWKCVHIFWGDERCVSLDDPRSNYKLAKDTLLSRVPIPESQIHPIYYGNDADQSATEYELLLKNYFKNSAPNFDFVFLGLGTDGHTASLFPGSQALEERNRWAVAVHKEGDGFDRVTLTLPVINHARMVAFLVEGEEKSEMVKNVLSSDRVASTLPAAYIKPLKGRLRWLIDAQAGKRIRCH